MSADVAVFPGIRVIELAQWVFVPMATTLLADWGAEVIKVEHPESGDAMRGLATQGIWELPGGINQSMELANRGKRSVGLDITAPGGLDVLLDLVRTADVFVTNIVPGKHEALGIGVDALREVNPRLIYARGHGFGVRGPDSDEPGYDASAFWARGGLGETFTPGGLEMPVRTRGALGDRAAAMQLAFGLASALFRRERTGEPSVVDASLLSAAIYTLASDVLAALQGSYKNALPAGASRDADPNPLMSTYRTSDGRFISLAFLQPDRYWADLCRAMGRSELAEDPRFSEVKARAQHREACFAVLDEIFASRTLGDWCRAFADERFPWAPFQRMDEVIHDPQVIANGYIGEVAVEGGEPFRLPTGPVQFDEQPSPLRRAPEHAQDTELLLLELGYDWDRIGDLKAAGAIS